MPSGRWDTFQRNRESVASERFDRVEARCANGWHEPGYDTDEDEDGSREADRAERDLKVDVALARCVLIERTEQRERRRDRSDRVGEHESKDSSHQRERERLEEELGLNVPTLRAERAPKADL